MSTTFSKIFCVFFTVKPSLSYRYSFHLFGQNKSTLGGEPQMENKNNKTNSYSSNQNSSNQNSKNTKNTTDSENKNAKNSKNCK